MTSSHLAYRADIDGLRAFAVVAVLIFHAFPEALPGGFVGVDVFFVISGFLITSIIVKALREGTFSFREFYARRVRRIFPALILVVLATLVIGWHVLLPAEYAELAKHALAGLGFVANFAYWLESGYFDTAAEFKPLLHLWSLGVEEQFYLVWPVILLAAWKLRINFGWLLLLLFGASFAANLGLSGRDHASAYFLPFGRAWELLAGAALVVLARPQWLGGLRKDIASVSGLLLLLVSVWLIDSARSFPGWWALLPVTGTVLVIAAGPDSVVNRCLLARKGVVFVGLISYPLYLWHWPLLSFARVLEGGAPEPGVVGICLLLAFVLAWLTWLWFERPVRLMPPRRAVAGLAVMSLVVMAGSGNIFARDGLSFRLKDAQARHEARALEWPSALQADPACAGRVSGGCLIARPDAEPDVAIVGDSHANHFYWGLSEVYAAKGKNLIQLGKGACPPLSGLEIMHKGVSLGCADATRTVLDYIVTTDSIRTVVLSARWMLYLSGRELRDSGGAREYDLASVAPQSADVVAEILFEKALEETLQKLEGAGKRVVFVQAVPEIGFNARECLSWQPLPFVRRVPRPECSIERQLHDAHTAALQPAMSRVLGPRPDVGVVAPADILCDSASCYARKDGVLLYRDDDHLSLDGSRWVSAWLAEQVGF